MNDQNNNEAVSQDEVDLTAPRCKDRRPPTPLDLFDEIARQTLIRHFDEREASDRAGH
jgi:hypothetical protein